MYETKHTPGPWVVEKAESSSTGSVHYAVKTDYKPAEHPWSPRFITFMCGGLGDFLRHRPMNDYRDDPQIEADVNLIAAAPELLEALKAAKEFIENLQAPDPEWDRVLDVCVAAIAKAEGRNV